MKRGIAMDLSEAIRIRICDLVETHNLTVGKLCTLSGISRSTLSKILSGKRKYIRLDILEYICEALNIELKDFFDSPVFKNVEVKE